jgi:hypothetical protein
MAVVNQFNVSVRDSKSLYNSRSVSVLGSFVEGFEDITMLKVKILTLQAQSSWKRPSYRTRLSVARYPSPIRHTTLFIGSCIYIFKIYRMLCNLMW